MTQNRSSAVDAFNVTFEALEYDGFRLDAEKVDLPKNGVPTRLPAHMTGPEQEHWRNAADDFLRRLIVEIPITLKFENPWGDRYSRTVTIQPGAALLLNNGKKPKIEHGAIRAIPPTADAADS